MLKRAVFGLLPTRAESTLGGGKRHSGASKDTSASRKGFTFQDEFESLSQAIGCADASEHSPHSATTCASLAPKEVFSDEEVDGEEEEEYLNEHAKLVLLKRAAVMYSSDPHQFLAAMKKHDGDLQKVGHKAKKKTRDTKQLQCKEEGLLSSSGQEDREGGRRRSAEASEGERSSSESSTSNEEEEDLALYDYSSEEDEKGVGGANGVKAETGELNFRGKFQCKLCPHKIFIFEADLEKHLQSKVGKTKRGARAYSWVGGGHARQLARRQ